MTADGQIKSFFQRWENLEAEKKQTADALKDLFAEAKGFGYDTKALRAAFRLKVKEDLDNPADAEFEAVVDTYLSAINAPSTSRRDARLRTRENIEKFDPETGEIPGGNSRRSDGGLNIVHKHTEIAGSSNGRTSDFDSENAGSNPAPVANTEIASASHGEAEAPSAERITPQGSGSAAANVGGDHVTGHQSAAISAGALANRAPAISKYRPHCQRPTNCGSGTRDHCWSCKQAMREGDAA